MRMKEDVTCEITRTLLHAQYKVAHRQVIEQMKVENLGQLETEDEIRECCCDFNSQ